MSGVQTLVVKSDQEVSTVDVKNSFMRELRGVEGLTVMPEESLVDASAANAVIERSVWEMQSTTRTLVTYAEWVHGTVFEPGSAILTWTVEFSGQVVSRFQRSVSDGKTAYERRKLKSYRKALVPFGELVMFMPMEKPKDNGEVRNCVGIMLGLVDRSDEVVIGTTERMVKARIVHRMLVEQRGDAAYAKSIRGVPWQPNPAEAAEGEPLGMAQARIVSVPMFAVETRPEVPVIEPRDYKARRFYIRREVELAKYGFSDVCEGCRVAQMGAEAKPHSEGCRERIGQAMMNDDVGQQRLRAAEQRGSSAGEQPSVATRVEAVQEGPDEAMNQALAAAAQEKRLLRAARGTSGPEWQRAAEWRTLCRRESEDRLRWVRQTTRISRQLTSHRWASAKWQRSSCRLVWHRRILKWPSCSAEIDSVNQPSTWASSAASWWTVRQAGA